MAKNNQEFAGFLRDEVNLNQGRLDRLETAVGAVNDYLKKNLTGYQKMEKQGSYALGTLIKPVDDNDEYDADIQIVMNPNSQWEAKDYILAVNRTLAGNKTYADKLRLKTRCVTVDYAGDFHLDVVPRVTIKGKHYVCNRIDNKFEETDGDGYRDWFNEKNRITKGNLKRVVRLLKHLRDHKNSFTAKSILLTTLAGNTVRPSDEGTEAVSTVADTLETVLSRMNDYLQQHPSMPEIRNPVLATENFNRHWDQRRYANFREPRAVIRWQRRSGRKPSLQPTRPSKSGRNCSATTSAKAGVPAVTVGEPMSSGSSARPGQGSSRGTSTAAVGAGSIPVAPRPNEARRFG